jgi:hypothetical protein
MQEAVIIERPAELEAQSTSLTTQAKNITSIITVDDYIKATDLGRSLRAMKKGLVDFWGPLKATAHTSWKQLCGEENKMVDPVDRAIVMVDDAICLYKDDQEKKRQEIECLAREAAQKAEHERAQAEAVALENAGQHEEAAQVIEQAIAAPPVPVIVPSAVPQVQGVSFTKRWKFRIVNEALIPREYLMVDEGKIGQVVRALKGQAKIAGIEVYPETSMTGRT